MRLVDVGVPSAVVYNGDCVEVMAAMPESSIDAVVCDPPYGLEFMGKEWDKLTRNLMRADSEADKKRLEEYGNSYSGRTSKLPDLGATAKYANEMQLWHEEWAREAFRVLKPGGHILAFGGTRTWHRMAVAIEDAGFEIRDSIAWLYGSGFPKSSNVAISIDKQQGLMGNRGKRSSFAGNINQGQDVEPAKGMDRHQPISEEAKKWDGWGTALKPAFEPVIVGRKPFKGTVAKNVLTHGTGALNIDATRIGNETVKVHNAPKGTLAGGEHGRGSVREEDGTIAYRETQGRWPANVTICHEPECEQVGTVTDSVPNFNTRGEDGPMLTHGGGMHGSNRTGDENEVGVGIWECVEGCQVAELNRQSGTSKSTGGRIGKKANANVNNTPVGNYEKGNPGFGDVGGASRFFYVAKASKKERPKVGETSHPTVKPIALMRWLVRLVTPPGGIVLDPFLGSGTTAEAAILEGFKFVGVEKTEDYLPLIQQRLNKYADG